MGSEKELREQLDSYSARYTEFQETLVQSNSTFKQFKADMQKM